MTPQFDAFRRRWAKAVDAGLIAAATVYLNAVKRRVQKGYTTGRWKTGNALNSITRTDPFDLRGVRCVRVGTNTKYMAYWEFGFHQRLWVWYDERKKRWYSRPGPTRFRRVEHWRLALEESQQAMTEAFYAAFFRTMREA